MEVVVSTAATTALLANVLAGVDFGALFGEVRATPAVGPAPAVAPKTEAAPHLADAADKDCEECEAAAALTMFGAIPAPSVVVVTETTGEGAAGSLPEQSPPSDGAVKIPPVVAALPGKRTPVPATTESAAVEPPDRPAVSSAPTTAALSERAPLDAPPRAPSRPGEVVAAAPAPTPLVEPTIAPREDPPAVDPPSQVPVHGPVARADDAFQMDGGALVPDLTEDRQARVVLRKPVAVERAAVDPAERPAAARRDADVMTPERAVSPQSPASQSPAPTASRPTSHTPQPVPAEDLERLQRLAELRPGPRDGGAMRVELAHETLGRIELRVAVRDDAVHASLNASHAHAQETLAAHRGELAAALGRANLRLEGFTVGLGQQGGPPAHDRPEPAPRSIVPAVPAAIEPSPAVALPGSLSVRA